MSPDATTSLDVDNSSSLTLTSSLSPITSSPPEVTSSLDEAEYIRQYLGWRYRGLGESLTLTTIYALILVTGVVGNVSTCVVIGRNRAMHSPTNFYLLSLAVSDVLTLCLGLPPELYAIWEAYPWRFGEPYCLFRTFLTEMTSTASVLTISAFTVERYLAICHPLRSHTSSGLGRAIRTIVLIWIVACVASVPFPLHTRAFPYVSDPRRHDSTLDDSYVCNIPSVWMPTMKTVFLAYTFVLFVVPMIAIVGLYASIGLTLRSRSQQQQQQQKFVQMSASALRSAVCRGLKVDKGDVLCAAADDCKEVYEASKQFGQRRQSMSIYSCCRQAVLKVLLAVAVTFFVCWAPFHAQRILTSCVRDDQWTPALIEIQHGLFYVSGILYYFSSTANPILYNLMSRKFRRAFRRTLCCGWWCHLSTACVLQRHLSPIAADADIDPRFQQQQQQHPLHPQKVVQPSPADRKVAHLVPPGDKLPPPDVDEEKSAASQGKTSLSGSRSDRRTRCYLSVFSSNPGGGAARPKSSAGSDVERTPSSRHRRHRDVNGSGGGGSRADPDRDDEEYSCDRDSVSSLPSTLAAYIREELEMSDIYGAGHVTARQPEPEVAAAVGNAGAA